MTVENDYGNMTAMVEFSGESVTDNSGEILTVTCDPPSNSTFTNVENVVTCTATDASGNVGSCNFTITLQDYQSPDVTCPADITVEYDYGNTTAVVEFSGESVTDNSGEILTVICQPASNSTFGDGTHKVMCFATDSSGNIGLCYFNVTVQDTTSPVVTCPSDKIVPYDYGNTTAVVEFGGESATDNSGEILSVTCTPPSNSTFEDGENVVTCSATDSSGNVGSCNFTITVEDNVTPVVTCPADMTVEYDYGNTTAVVEFSGESATDNSGATLTVTCDPPSNSTFFSGVNIVVCSATDEAGLNGTCTFNITVQDTTLPVLTCPTNITVENEYGNLTAVVAFDGESATDNAGHQLSVTCDPPSNSTFSFRENVVTCSATDRSGNVGTCSFTVVVEDIRSPVVNCPANVTSEIDDGNTTAVVEFDGESATDNSGQDMVVTCDPPSNSTFGYDVTVVTCSATDLSGNNGSCEFTVTVEDTTPPVVSCPPRTFSEYDYGNTTAVVTFSSSATDNSGYVNVTCDPPSGSVFGKGNTRVYCAATDFAGNQDTCNFRVTVRDRTDPVLTCPPSQTVELENGNTTIVTFDGESATDNSGQDITVVCDPSSNSSFPVGETIVTCYGIDASNNVGTCGFKIVVQDTTDPSLTCPANLTVEYDYGNTTAVVTFNTSASDNSGYSLDVTCSPPSGSTFESGTTEVTCTATDDASNEGSCTFFVTVQDTTSPEVTCPVNITVTNDYGNTTAFVVFDGESVTDNSGVQLNVTCDPPSNTTFTSGPTTVTCTSIDMAGNVGTCTFTVLVQDTVKPTISCPADITVEYDYGNTSALVEFSGEYATDNSGSVLSVVCDPPSNSTFWDGENVVTCVATDGAGLAASCNFTVTVQDTTPPMVTCPAVMTVEYDYGNSTAVVEFSGESVTDNSGATLSVTCDPPSNSTFADGENVVTCTATDASGNVGSCNFTITVQDTIAAVLTCPADMTVEYDYGNTTAVVEFADAKALDNSGESLAVTCVPPSNTTFPDGEHEVTCSATDGSGNVGSCNFTIIVQDTTDPVVVCPNDLVVEYDYGNTTAVVEFSGESVTDNSGEILSVTCDPPSNSTFGDGENVVTCSATDAAGNVGTCNFTITVEDTTNPVVTCPADMNVEYDYGNTSAVVEFSGESVTDNSGETLTVTCDPPSNSTFWDGENVVTCTATDASGNVGTCNFTITVEDTTEPVVTCPADITVEYDYGNTTAVVEFSGESVTDNSGEFLTVACSPPSNSTFGDGENVVTCSATDSANNTGSCNFTITVQDTTKPEVTCPADMTVENDHGNTTAVVEFSGESVTDNSGETLSVTCDPPSNSTFVDGDNVVTCTATDASGNVGTCNFTITVEDAVNPIVTCPADITVENEYGNMTAVVDFGGESATDNSGNTLSVTCDPPANSTFFSEGNVVTCSATDGSGNTGTCNFTVTVQDTENPIVTCPADITVEYDYGNTTAVVEFSGESVTDNSGETLSVTCDPSSNSTFEDGETVVTCSATDSSGNTGTCNFTITVEDTSNPVVICPADMAVEYDYGNTTAVVEFGGESATDNSGHSLSVTCDPPSNSTFLDSENIVTCSATDLNNNTGSCNFTITVQDTTDPVVTCPSVMVVEYDYGNTSAVVGFSGESVTDNSVRH
ncbi:hyalin-like [Ptychodera flava]|uniref:hyalin-like n=1 Tax=Ptychodera flava TaxID=63121 RepID=UPI003969C5E5